MVTGKRKYAYAGLGFAALLISPGATPIGDLYLFIALVLLFEVSIAVGKRFEHNTDPANQPFIQAKLFPTPRCKFCKSLTDIDSSFCPQCKRYIK
jgi:hypothetical protein